MIIKAPAKINLSFEIVGQRENVFHFFKGATVSGKGPATWVKRDYYYAYVKEEKVPVMAGGLDTFMQEWDGDIFITQPVQR